MLGNKKGVRPVVRVVEWDVSYHLRGDCILEPNDVDYFNALPHKSIYKLARNSPENLKNDQNVGTTTITTLYSKTIRTEQCYMNLGIKTYFTFFTDRTRRVQPCAFVFGAKTCAHN